MNDGYRQYLADHRPQPKPLNLPKALASFLGTLHARPDATIEVTNFVSAFRDSLPQRHRYQAGRRAIVEALGRLGVLIGTAQKRQCIIGYGTAAAPSLAVDPNTGKIVEVA